MEKVRPCLSVLVYKPKEGKEDELRERLREHVPMLRDNGYATPRRVIMMRSRIDGSYLEIFEWVNAQAEDAAKADKGITQFWKRIHECAELTRLGDIAQAPRGVASFEPIMDLVS